MDSITFYVDNEDIVCDFQADNPELFKVLIFSLFSGSLTESTLGYITNELIKAGKAEDAESLKLVSSAFCQTHRPVIEASQFR